MTENTLKRLDELKAQFAEREIHLSASKLKNLTTPLNFTLSILKPKTENAGMMFGSLVDTLITQESKFNELYLISDISISAGNQTDIVNHVVTVYRETEDKLSFDLSAEFVKAFSLFYKRGKPEDIPHVKTYLENLLIHNRKIITQEMYDKAVFVSERLLTNDSILEILEQTDEFQKYVEFTYRGWLFKGFIDILALSNFYDLKFLSNLNPDNFHRVITDFGYDIQFAVYKKALQAYGINKDPSGFFIAYNDKGENALIRFGEDYMDYAERKLDVYINRLERIIRDDAWLRSYDYFTPNLTVRKPKWIAGFSELDQTPIT